MRETPNERSNRLLAERRYTKKVRARLVDLKALVEQALAAGTLDIDALLEAIHNKASEAERLLDHRALWQERRVSADWQARRATAARLREKK
jgi:hypothetical protein